MITSLSRSPLRWTVAALTAAVTFAASGATAGATAPLAAAGVEDEGAGCAVPGLPDAGSLPTVTKLPDPFTKLGGGRVTAKADWRCRREEIKKLAEKFVYGEKPPKPSSVTGTVSSSSITVNVAHNGRSAGFSAGVQLPTSGGSGPYPAVVVLGGLGADTATIRAAGAAVISYDPLAVGKEGTARTSKQGAFYTIYGATSGTGLLAAWAWGVSRIIDVIEQSGGGILRADATGVTGCSRYGKGAFVAGAFDQRIALTMPIESGSGGVAALRAIPGESGAQPLSSAYSEQPWLGDAFSSFTGSPARLPVDTHEVVGMIAPRGLFIMDNPHIDWLAARSASVAALGGAEIYKALGAGGNITYWSDVQDGTHCATRPEWRTPLQQNIQKFLLGSGGSTGTMRIAAVKSGNLAEWRDWTTPALSDTTTDTTPPTAPAGLAASATTSTGATLTWTAATDDTGVTGYDVLRAPGASGGAFTQAGASATTSFTDTGLTPGTTYRYQVRARDAAGNLSPVSNTVQVTTQPGTPTGGCAAVPTVQTQWSTGYVIQPLTITNTGTTTMNGWTVTFTLPAGHTLTGSWNGTVSVSGQTVTVRNVGYNGTLAPGAATTTFGFQAGRPSGDASFPSGYTCA
ncbi:cellulose binding domain-containing protein [Actinomadura sp. ATCC 31491]|uniref:Cellulose binding domain-containing protein n=1 Tax=Actinomadura luzonensis TaxID=2805427 RepID=A0ABT0FRP4_9ACTN|nr:cellulose binding domain-containing protein [Actinomadura luzonensis]MCK2214695.1 cellulose binding domain-containing protein [Actinomadura luzonensis]